MILKQNYLREQLDDNWLDQTNEKWHLFDQMGAKA